MLKIFIATIAALTSALTSACAQAPPFGPGGMLRPWHWPTEIQTAAGPEQQNPKPAAPLTMIAQVRSERLFSASDGSFILAAIWAKGSLALYRNGLRQMPGVDYAEERESKRIEADRASGIVFAYGSGPGRLREIGLVTNVGGSSPKPRFLVNFNGRTSMKTFTRNSIPALAAAAMGLVLAGCQQNPPPATTTTTPPSSSTTMEHTTTSNTTETKTPETPAATPDSSATPSGAQSTTTQQSTTTVEKKKTP